MIDGNQTGFIRTLGRWDVLALSFGAMIGWSWVLLTGRWIEDAGTMGAVIAFIVGGLAIVFVGLTYAELASAMPHAGGEHVYAHKAYGANYSFICTWAIVLAYTATSAFESVALPSVVTYIFPNFNQYYLWTVAGWDVYLTPLLLAIGASIAITWINVIGIKTAAFLQSLTTIFILIGGVVFLTGATLNGTSQNMDPIFTGGLSGILMVLVLVPTMMVGFDVIPQSAEEIDLPFNEVGKLVMVSVVLAALWYILMIIGVGLSLGDEGRGSAKLVTADAAAAAWGSPNMGIALVLAGMMGIITSWNAFVIGGSRAIYALARSGQLPEAFGRLHPKYRTPHNAVILIGILCVLAPFFGRQVLVWLVDTSSFGVTVAYAMVAVAFLKLRKSEPDMERPFKVKHGNIVGWLALFSSLGLVFLFMPGSPAALIWPQEWAIVGGWSLFGFVLISLSKKP
ncbi:MAG: APC family permease [Sphingomonadales bacterium]